MDADGQAQVGRVGRSVGVPNYKNDILISVDKEYLPQGLEAWRGVAMAKPNEVVADALSSETTKQQSTNSRHGGGGDGDGDGNSDNDSGRRRWQQRQRRRNVVDSDNDYDSGDNNNDDGDGHSGLRRRRRR